MAAISARSPLAYRYFYALLPDEVTARRIHAFAERALGTKGLMRSDRLHVTLAITPDFDAHQSALVECLLRAGAVVSAEPFDLVLNELSGSRRTAALRPVHSLPPLRTLQAGIAQAMADQGVEMRPDWRFSPHLTLLYRDGEPVWRAVDNLGWPVRDFVLIESVVGLTRHTVLGRWPLSSPVERQPDLFGPERSDPVSSQP